MSDLSAEIEIASRDASQAREIVTWLAGFAGDLGRAVEECPSVEWLVVLARACGQDLAVDRWWADLSPSERATEAGRQLAIDGLRSVVSAARMREYVDALPEVESPEQRDNRIIERALQDMAEIVETTGMVVPEGATRAGALVGMVGARTFRRVSKQRQMDFVRRVEERAARAMRRER